MLTSVVPALELSFGLAVTQQMAILDQKKLLEDLLDSIIDKFEHGAIR